MNSVYQPAFIKDLRRLRGHLHYERIRHLVFDEMPNWKNLTGRSQIKCLSAQEKAYRIRVGDYRIGFYIAGEELIFARVLHRREIYRYFP